MYRGWSSTKLHLTLIAMAAVTAAYAFTGFAPDLFGTYCVTMVGFAGSSHAAAVVEKATAKPPAPPPET